VIGHPRDPIHPFSDADMLVRELPDARLIEASSIVELRIAPERLTEEIADFVDGCWTPRRSFEETYLEELFKPFTVIERRYIYGKQFVDTLQRGFGIGCYHLQKLGGA
jgi:hypothetical protein